MSFISLRLLVEDAVEQKTMKPGEKLCPVMSRYGLERGPMDKEPSLSAFTIICIGDKCGMFNRCFNLPGQDHAP